MEFEAAPCVPASPAARHGAASPPSPPSSPSSSSSSLPVSPGHVVLKLSFRGETCRLTMDAAEVTYAAVQRHVQACHEARLERAHARAARRAGRSSSPASTKPSPATMAFEPWVLVYRDNENELVTVASPEEFAEARRVFLELKRQRLSSSSSSHSNHDDDDDGEGHDESPRPSPSLVPHVHFHVLPRPQATPLGHLRAQLAPVLAVVGELPTRVARVAGEARESLRQHRPSLSTSRESIATSAEHTRAALVSAGRGVSRRIRSMSNDLKDRVERRRSRFASCDSVDDLTTRETLMAVDVERHDDDEEDEEAPTLTELLARARAEEEAEEAAAAAVAALTAKENASNDDDHHGHDDDASGWAVISDTCDAHPVDGSLAPRH